MRALTVVAVLLASGARSLCAQHGGQLEIGGFGSYTRYDSRFQLDNQFGAGGWLGYFLGDHFALEVDGTVAQPRSTFSGVGGTTSAFASASLVMSSGGFYILGGYSRLHMGPGAPYTSDLNAVHADILRPRPCGRAPGSPSLLPRPWRWLQQQRRSGARHRHGGDDVLRRAWGAEEAPLLVGDVYFGKTSVSDGSGGL